MIVKYSKCYAEVNKVRRVTSRFKCTRLFPGIFEATFATHPKFPGLPNVRSQISGENYVHLKFDIAGV
jgi:hypothetical protein